MDRHLFDKWLSVAEANARLLKLKGGLWHRYRRKWTAADEHGNAQSGGSQDEGAGSRERTKSISEDPLLFSVNQRPVSFPSFPF